MVFQCAKYNPSMNLMNQLVLDEYEIKRDLNTSIRTTYLKIEVGGTFYSIVQMISKKKLGGKVQRKRYSITELGIDDLSENALSAKIKEIYRKNTGKKVTRCIIL